jgi:predicted phage terminase large subunit-like protein
MAEQITAEMLQELGVDPMAIIKEAKRRKDLVKKEKPPEWMDCIWKYAEHNSRGQWIAYRWLRFVAEKVQAAIERGNARILLTAPPQHGKSNFISHWLPLWYLDMFPKNRVILASYSDDLAGKWGRLARNKMIDKREGNAKIGLTKRQYKGDVARAKEWETTEGGGMLCVSIRGGATGRSAELEIIDDPIKNWTEAHSAAYNRDLIDWYRSVYRPRLQHGGSIVCIMTRWTDSDFGEFLKSKESGELWEVINLPAIAEENDMMGREIGEPLCPERFTIEDLNILKPTVGTMVWEGLYQQHPAPLEGNIFKRAWWKFWKVLPAKFDFLMFSWDMAFKDNANSSFVVGGLWGVLGANRYLIDIVRDQMDFTNTIRAVKTFGAKYPSVIEKLVEDKANGTAIINTLKNEIPGFIEWNPQGKVVQAIGVSPLVEAGNVFIPDPQFNGSYIVDNKTYQCDPSWVNDYINELAKFPNGKNDDQVDMTTNALLRLQNKFIDDNIDVDMSINETFEGKNYWSISEYNT